MGSGSEGMASAAQYQASKHERNKAWKRQILWEQMQPTLRMQGLEAAGLNPMLAVMQPHSGGHSPPMATTGGSPSFDKDTVGRAISSAKQGRLMELEVQGAAKRLEILQQQVYQEENRTRQSAVDTEIKARYGVPAAAAALANQQQQLLNLTAELGLTSARTGQSEQERLRIHTDRALMEMGIPGARAMEELYEKHPWLRQVQGAIGGGLGGLGAGAVGGAAGWLMQRGEKKKPAAKAPGRDERGRFKKGGRR